MEYLEIVEAREKLHAESEGIVTVGGDNGSELTEEQLSRITEINTEISELDDQIRAEDAKVAALDAVARRADAAKAVPARTTQAALPVIEGMRDRREDDGTCGFAHAGLFYAAAYDHFMGGGASDERLLIGAAASGMSQGSGADGGILVPPSFAQTIWDGLNTGAENLLGLTDTYDVEGDSLTMPANAETSRADGSRYGGVRGYWIAEAAQKTSSHPKLRQLKLEPKEMAVFVYVTDKLLRNAKAVGQYVTRAATDEIRFMTGDAIINGDGAGKPLGLLAAGSTISQGAETAQAAATIVAENIINMWARLHARARAGAVWYINQEIEPQLMTMSIAVGTGGQLIYMPPGGISGGQYGTLFGRPVVPIEYCQALGTEGDVILADLGAYASGVKSAGVMSDVSIHLRFDYNETAFRFVFEVDGQPWLASALTPYKGSNTLSTAVTLATRA